MSAARGRIAFLLSGSGSTLLNLFAAIERGEVPGEVVVVASDRPGVKGLEHARERGVPTLVVERTLNRGREAYGRALEAALAPHRADLVVLGGFLTLFAIPPGLAGRVLNVHPSLLPRHGGPGCWGLHVHRAVLDAGDRESGCTVHVVTDEVDGGPIVAQRRVPVLAGDTPEALAARVQEAERALFPPAIAAFLRGEAWVEQGRLRWREGARPG
ncbi:MAG: phosphoribosylglycinamide formyltransferase [Planctomycetia bacterium]